MATHFTPLNAETAYAIAAVCLFSTNHWIGSVMCLALAYYTSHHDRKSRELSNVPSDEIGVRSGLPSIQSTVDPVGSKSTPDVWKQDSNT